MQHIKDIPISHQPIIKSDFKASWWARNRHVQTIFPRFFQRRAKLRVRPERFSLPDGDFVQLAWCGDVSKAKALVVMFHGLEGSIRSHYANDMAAHLVSEGYAVVMMHFRGCGGQTNLRPRAYHSGETEDPWHFLSWLKQQYPALPLLAIGFSLGGNMLLKLLGERPDQTLLHAAIAISPPFKLEQCALSINQGFSRFYQGYLMRSMCKNLVEKMQSIDYQGKLSIGPLEISALKTFRDFDQAVTAPLHGFSGADDYYQKCSAFKFTHNIQTPTLVLHAKDDPFMNEHVLPSEKELSAKVRIELSEKGGHVGFMYGSPWRPKIWTHQRVSRYFAQELEAVALKEPEEL